jgi:peptide/nickel transport system substrate-binding protein
LNTERLLQLIFSSTILFLIGCASNESTEKEKSVFRYNEHANITSLDPAFARDQRNIWAVHQLYNTLVGLDEELLIVPEIAKSWEVNEDGLIYTFNLRDDVYFHKSNIFSDSLHKVTANDVKFSLERLSNKVLASPGSEILNAVESINILNDYKISFKLKEPFPAFLGVLSMKYCSIIPEEAKDRKVDFRKNPVGSGPFLFKRWIPQEKLVFRKNPYYFEEDSTGKKLPYLEAVAITFLPEKQSEFMQFIQGNLDFISGLDVSYKDELLRADGHLNQKYENRINMDKSPYLNTEYIGFFLEDTTSIVRDIRIRKAINYGFNKSKMVKYLRNGIGIPAEQGFIPKGLPSWDETNIGYRYNKDKAKSLIDSFKKETNIKNPEVTISTNPSYQDLIGFMQAELQSIGLKINIEVLPSSTLRQKRSEGKLEAFRSSWIADYPDAQNYLSLFYSKNKSPIGSNYTHYNSKVYDSLFNLAIETTSVSKRLKFYRKLDSLVLKDAAVVPLFYDEAIRFKHMNIEGLSINPINLLDLKRVYKN